jgi:two-component system OmpR family sensor kinase
LAGVLAILVVLGLVAWWMLRLGIRPIKQMTSVASTIAAGDLSARADESSPAAESHELAVALNTMLGTIETAMDERAESESRLRRFVADASHELRTPVTTIRGSTAHRSSLDRRCVAHPSHAGVDRALP